VNGIRYARKMEILTTVNMKILILMMEAVISPEMLITLRLHGVTSQLEKVYNHSPFKGLM
jgi:hypothetical protein